METKAMSVLSRIVSILVTVIFAASGVVSPRLNQQVTPKDAQNLRLSFATLLDTHLTTVGVARQTMLSQGFRDLDGNVDVIATVGDMTDHGERTQYENFYDCVKKDIKSQSSFPLLAITTHGRKICAKKSPPMSSFALTTIIAAKSSKRPISPKRSTVTPSL